jgi:antitoxin FitA
MIKYSFADKAGRSITPQAQELHGAGLLAKPQRAAAKRTGRSAWEMLRSAFAETGELDGEFAEIMDEIEAERKPQFRTQANRRRLMGDMLIRGIDPGLKRYLEASAKRNGRSLSEEAIAMLRRAAAVEQATMERPGDRLRALVGDAYFTNEEIEAIAASRHEPDRALPSFG